MGEGRARLALIARRFGGVGELARAVGLSDNAIYKWLAGRGQPSLASAMAIARAAGVSLEWLAGGRERTAEGLRGQPPSGDYITMPRGEVRLGSKRGGRLRTPQIVDVISFAPRWLRSRLTVDPERLILLEVSGDAMEPTLRHGDLALADLRENHARVDGLYVLRQNGDLAVKRLQRRGVGARLIVRSDNFAYPPMEIPAAQIKIVGRVIWMGKAL
jgi:phage repressor protein C with HTH and peptisase S24 domain